MKNYDHKKIEKKHQLAWDKSKIYKAIDNSRKEKFYPLVEFPFPSGAGLHTGHIRSYTAMDIVARKRRMEGKNVLYPIGWDAFGLPTENYAIKTGKQPRIVTKQNTDIFRRQLKSLGLSFDWSREVNTTDPEYYRWTQWIFLKMYEKGLAYKARIAINWCPKDKIGLANEEVVDGCCERCGTAVEKRNKEQWMLAITKYADRLYKDLDNVNYLEKIKIQQRNWIGRSEGAELDFAVKGRSEKIKVFTTRPDTLFGVTYVVVAPESELMTKFLEDKKLISNRDEVMDYVVKSKTKTEIERTDATKTKTGVELKGIKAINPSNKEEVPIFVADYVLADYGTGAVMAVPAHDDRDFDFAKKYDLPIKTVIEPLFERNEGEDAVRKDLPFTERNVAAVIVKHHTENKYICLEWKKNGWKGFILGGIEGNESAIDASIREIREETGYKNIVTGKIVGTIHSKFYQAMKNQNRFAHFTVVTATLKDDEREEMSEEEKAIHYVKWISASEVEKFVNRDDMKMAWSFASKGEVYVDDGILVNSPLWNGKKSEEIRKSITESVGGKWVVKYKLKDWVFSRQRYWGEPIPMINCQKCGWVPVPERELPVTLPPVKKYEPTDTGESPLSTITKWVNVKCPKCKGDAKRETDTMPNWAGSSWYFLRYIDPKNKKSLADIKKLKYWMPADWYNGGMEHTTLHLLYSRFWYKFLFDIGVVPTSEPYTKRTSQGMILAEGGVKMSKSIGNVINPDSIIKKYGADTLRVYEMFIGPFDQSVAWSTDSIIGSRRFIEKIWKLGQKVSKSAPINVDLETILHKTIKKVSEDIEAMRFNTAISSLMILLNDFEKVVTINKKTFEIVLKLHAPFAPHIAEDLWQQIGNKKSIHIEKWPTIDESKIVSEKVKLAIQVNGKVRSIVEVGNNASEKDIQIIVESLPDIKKWIDGKKIIKIIHIPNRVFNIVV